MTTTLLDPAQYSSRHVHLSPVSVHPRQRRALGYSLIDLMIVVTIIALLSGIGLLAIPHILSEAVLRMP